jgi:hypothetical protein
MEVICISIDEGAGVEAYLIPLIQGTWIADAPTNPFRTSRRLQEEIMVCLFQAFAR